MVPVNTWVGLIAEKVKLRPREHEEVMCLLDLCTLDIKSLSFPSSTLSASAVYTVTEKVIGMYL